MVEPLLSHTLSIEDKVSRVTASKTSPAEGPVEAGSSPAVAAIDVRRLAHELRTPLSAIAAMSEIIRDERLGPVDGERYRGYAAGIHESAGHAMSVLASFLEPGTPTRPSGVASTAAGNATPQAGRTQFSPSSSEWHLQVSNPPIVAHVVLVPTRLARYALVGAWAPSPCG